MMHGLNSVFTEDSDLILRSDENNSLESMQKAVKGRVLE
jgi:hypothetical protein